MECNRILQNGGLEVAKAVALAWMVVGHFEKFVLEIHHGPLDWYIGRFVWPVFVYLVWVGVMRTRDVWAYVIRMAVLGAVTQIAYVWVVGDGLNVMVGLSLAGVSGGLGRSGRALEVMAISGLAYAIVGPVEGAAVLGVGVAAMVPGVGVWCLLWVFASLAVVMGPDCAAMPLGVLLCVACSYVDCEQRLPRWLAYGIYPGHLVALGGVRWVISSI